MKVPFYLVIVNKTLFLCNEIPFSWLILIFIWLSFAQNPVFFSLFLELFSPVSFFLWLSVVIFQGSNSISHDSLVIEFLFQGGKIYCYANFFCYAVVFGPNFREGQKFSGGQTVSGGTPCPPRGRKPASVIEAEIYWLDSSVCIIFWKVVWKLLLLWLAGKLEKPGLREKWFSYMI